MSCKLGKCLAGPVLMVAAIGFAVVLSEFILRLFAPQPLLGVEPAFVAREGNELYQLQANLDQVFSVLDGSYRVITSPSGNRGTDPENNCRETDNPHERFVFCGDSFCFGNGVDGEESIPGQVQEMVGDTVEVYNIGQPGYSLPQTAARLQWFLERWGADRAFLLFFTGNDFEDCHPERLGSIWIDDSGAIRVGDETMSGGWREKTYAIRYWLWKNSMLFSLVRRSLANFKSPPVNPAALYQEGFPTNDSLLIKTVETSLDSMAAYCEQFQCDFTVVIIPSHIQADDEWWSGSMEGTNADRWAPQRWLNNWCISRNVGCIDLAPVTLEMGRVAFLPTDRHFTPEGNRNCAEYIVDQMSRQEKEVSGEE